MQLFTVTVPTDSGDGVRKDTEENACRGDNSGMKIAIEVEINKIPDEGLRLKKFRKAILEQFGDRPVQEVKDEFAALLDKFCENGIVSLDGGILTRLKAGKSY